MKILIADDDPQILRALRITLDLAAKSITKEASTAIVDPRQVRLSVSVSASWLTYTDTAFLPTKNLLPFRRSCSTGSDAQICRSV